MKDLFRETVFGRIIRAISGGRIFGYDEELTALNLEKYQPIQAGSSSTSLTNAEKQNLQDGVKVENPGQENTVSIDQEKGKDHLLVTWSPNDPQNPRNWSTLKKLFVTFQICLLTTSVYIGSAIYTAGLEGVEAQFHISQVKALLGLTLFVIGYALGPMVWAPMSEVPYIGRNPVYVGTLFAFVILQFPVIYASNSSMLLGFRFITGLVGSPVLATGGATIADIYKPQKQAYGIGVWGIAAVFGPAMGPLVGGFAAESKGWKWTIWELMWLSGFCFVFLFFFLPETSSSNILYRRTLRIRAATHNPKVKCEPEIEAEGMSGKEIGMMVFVRPFTLSFTEPICFLLNLYLALIYGLLYLWFESFPIVFFNIYHFTLGTEGLAFLGILIGTWIIMIPYFYYNYKYVEPQFDASGRLRPEIRLQPAFVGAFLIPICLFWFGWSARSSVHWIMPIIGSSFFSMGSFLLFMAVLAYLGDAYPKYIASVFAGNDLMRSAFGAAFPLFANAMYHKLGVGWASSLLGFLSIAFVPIPFVLYYYGARIRGASKMATHEL
ncbi:GTPase-activating protein [Lecanora helva]